MENKKIIEEVKKFNKLYRYNFINEQEELPPLPDEGDAAGGELPALPDEGDAPADTDLEGDEMEIAPAPEEVEEIDITDLVNMTKSIKKQLEDNKSDESEEINKLDNVFTKLDDLEQKIANMDRVLEKIDQLSIKIDNIKEPTPEERLEMRSLDSYPFNTNPSKFFETKKQEMGMSGKNEYVLRKQDIEDYTDNEIMKTFNPDIEDEY